MTTNDGGARAWRFLKRNPRYIEARDGTAPAPREPAPFPLRAQTEADLDAAAWGLLAWEDPREDGLTCPFWAEAPFLEAIPSPWPPVADLAREPGWRLSGLRLADGAVVLKVEHGACAVQLRIADGAGFDPAGGVLVVTPAGLRLPVLLRRAADLWPAAAAGPKKAAAAFRTGSFSGPWTRSSPAVACAA